MFLNWTNDRGMFFSDYRTPTATACGDSVTEFCEEIIYCCDCCLTIFDESEAERIKQNVIDELKAYFGAGTY